MQNVTVKTAASLAAGDVVVYGSGPTEVLGVKLMPEGITFDYADGSCLSYKPGGYLIKFKCRLPFKKNFRVYTRGATEFTIAGGL